MDLTGRLRPNESADSSSCCCVPEIPRRIQSVRAENSLPRTSNDSSDSGSNTNNWNNDDNIDIVVMKKELDAFLAQDFSELSLEEQRRISDEMDGLSTTMIEEKPLFVQQCLDGLENELQKTRGTQAAAAYDRAIQLNPDYVQNRLFRLMFLRSQLFVPSKAATLLLRHFDYKLQLFGEQLLTKDITYQDLTVSDRECLHRGAIQNLQIRDAYGRIVYFLFPNRFDFHSWENLIRSAWYLTMLSAKQDESTLIRGAVAIVFGAPNPKFHRLIGKLYFLEDGLPRRQICTHICIFNQGMKSLAKLFVTAFSKSSRQRFHLHFKHTQIECMYVLQSYGINPDSIPLRDDGTPEISRFLQLLEKQKQEEAEKIEQPKDDDNTSRTTTASNTTDALPSPTMRDTMTTSSKNLEIIQPTPYDVLLGQGKQHVSHPGNETLDRLIEQELSNFQETSSQFAKSCVILGVAQKVKDSGGRFLIRDKKTKQWVKVRTAAIQGAIGSRFRYRLLKNNNPSSSSYANKPCVAAASRPVAVLSSSQDVSQSQSEQNPSSLQQAEYATKTMLPEESEHSIFNDEEQKELLQLQELQEQLKQQERMRISLVNEHEQLQRQLQQEQQVRWQMQHDMQTATAATLHHLLYEKELVEQQIRLQVAEIQNRSRQMQQNDLLRGRLDEQRLRLESTLALLQAARNQELSNYLKRQL